MGWRGKKRRVEKEERRGESVDQGGILQQREHSNPAREAGAAAAAGARTLLGPRQTGVRGREEGNKG